jgi:hypothetical protein
MQPFRCKLFTGSYLIRILNDRCRDLKWGLFVIPAQAGIQIATLGSCLRGNDGTPEIQALALD